MAAAAVEVEADVVADAAGVAARRAVEDTSRSGWRQAVWSRARRCGRPRSSGWRRTCSAVSR